LAISLFSIQSVEAFTGEHAIHWGTEIQVRMSWGCRKLFNRIKCASLRINGADVDDIKKEYLLEILDYCHGMSSKALELEPFTSLQTVSQIIECSLF
jgi:hypothetical protein